eukprot:5845407-Pleurochrysis_carterae.AAC.2
MPDISKSPRNGCLRTPEAYILARGVNTIPYRSSCSKYLLVPTWRALLAATYPDDICSSEIEACSTPSLDACDLNTHLGIQAHGGRAPAAPDPPSARWA